MKKKSLVGLGVLLALASSGVFADIVLKSATEVEGTWKLDHTKVSATAKESLPREDTWVFKNGKLTIQHIPREGTYYDQPPVNYEIVEGKLKVSLVGGSRFELYTVVEKTATNMVLKGKFGSYSYYVKK